MKIIDIFHVAIRAQDLEATLRFYCVALGFSEVARPPGLKFPGAWLGASNADGPALMHVYGKTAVADGSDEIPPDNELGRVDHISLRAHGAAQYRSHFVRLGLTFREQSLSESAPWQIFVHDPNGIKIELTFDRRDEVDLPAGIPADLQYVPNERFFNRADYWRLNAGQAGGVSA